MFGKMGLSSQIQVNFVLTKLSCSHFSLCYASLFIPLETLDIGINKNGSRGIKKIMTLAHCKRGNTENRHVYNWQKQTVDLWTQNLRRLWICHRRCMGKWSVRVYTTSGVSQTLSENQSLQLLWYRKLRWNAAALFSFEHWTCGV